MVFTLPQFMYAYINGYSGQTIYDDYYITCYNMVFTALPLAAKAIYDQDVNPHLDGS
jgi:magnesium-transporting ATPase (P-type)